MSLEYTVKHVLEALEPLQPETDHTWFMPRSSLPRYGLNDTNNEIDSLGHKAMASFKTYYPYMRGFIMKPISQVPRGVWRA